MEKACAWKEATLGFVFPALVKDQLASLLLCSPHIRLWGFIWLFYHLWDLGYYKLENEIQFPKLYVFVLILVSNMNGWWVYHLKHTFLKFKWKNNVEIQMNNFKNNHFFKFSKSQLKIHILSIDDIKMQYLPNCAIILNGEFPPFIIQQFQITWVGLYLIMCKLVWQILFPFYAWRKSKLRISQERCH